MRRLSVLLIALLVIGLTPPAASSAPALHWVAFGDSITVGWSASSLENSFIGRLAAATGPIDNRAISATRIHEQLTSIQAYTGTATAVIWLTGYNDMRAGTPLEQYRQDLATALDDFAQRGMRVYLGLCLHMTPEGYAAFGPLWNHGSDAAVAALNDVIRDTARAYTNVRIVDTANYSPAAGVAGDLVHPNDLGHQQIATAFLLKIRPPVYLPVIGLSTPLSAPTQLPALAPR